MTETCNRCEYKERCKDSGISMEIEDKDECEQYYSYSEHELEEAE